MKRLTSRDAVATVLVAVAGIIYVAVSRGWDWPLLGGYRAGTAALLIVGMAMCATGGSSNQTISMSNGWIATQSVLGVAALAFVIIGLVSGSSLVFAALAATIGVMWLISLVYHASTDRPVAPRGRTIESPPAERDLAEAGRR